MSVVADLLIVGGGPAGLALSILARTMGFSVGVVEAVRFPRNAHGDTLPAGIEIYFEMLGISKERLYRDAVPFSSHQLRWRSQEIEQTGLGQPESQLPQSGLHLPRHFLDPLLLERAREMGVQILQPCVVKKVLLRGERVCGIATDKGDFPCRFVIDAAGSRHWLARKLGMELKYYSPTLFGYYGWARGHCPECHDSPFVYSDPNGWTWISRVEPDLYQFTRQTFSEEPDSRRYLPREFIEHGLVPIAPTRGADLTWRIVERPAGPGYFMIGDAVRRSDPVSQRGIERGIIDACKVAVLLNRWRDKILSEQEVAQVFNEDMHADYLKGLGVSYGFLRTHPQAPEWLHSEEFFMRGPELAVS